MYQHIINDVGYKDVLIRQLLWKLACIDTSKACCPREKTSYTSKPLYTCTRFYFTSLGCKVMLFLYMSKPILAFTDKRELSPEQHNTTENWAKCLSDRQMDIPRTRWLHFRSHLQTVLGEKCIERRAEQQTRAFSGMLEIVARC